MPLTVLEHRVNDFIAAWTDVMELDRFDHRSATRSEIPPVAGAELGIEG